MTTNDLDQAREWAKLAVAHKTSEVARAAAKVIQSLPDGWIDADNLREVIADWGSREVTSDAYTLYRQVLALVPAPTPRTLADMDDDEREACQWMKVEVYGVPCELGVIIYLTEYHATVMWHDGTTTLRDHKELTPLPHLPRLEWPASEPVTEDTPEQAPFGNSEQATRPEDVPEGELWLVEVYGQRDVAQRELPGTENPWWLMRGWSVSDEEVTLVSRLVPESTPDHPAVLTTEEDYENAPEGTIVAMGAEAWTKTTENEWSDPTGRVNDKYMSSSVRRVLRWGWSA